MKRTIFVIALCIPLLTACFWGDESFSDTQLTKDFWLQWWADSTDQHILLCRDDINNGGSLIIKQTVFAVGYDDNFIIAKRHPDKQEEIQKRLFKRDDLTGHFYLENPADTIWLSKDDQIYQKDGKWYHTNNGWNPPDSLKPYRAITNYHIVDIRKYDRQNSRSYQVYSFDNENGFINKRKELGVPDNLTFSIICPSLQ